MTAVEEDAAIAKLEHAYVAAAIHLTQHPQLLLEVRNHLSARAGRGRSECPQATAAAASAEPADTIQEPVRCASPGQPPATAWRYMAELDLEGIIRQPARTVREPPRWFRGSLRQAFAFVLRAREQRPTAAWKFFVLVPRMLLGPTDEAGDVSKKVFFDRM